MQSSPASRPAPPAVPGPPAAPPPLAVRACAVDGVLAAAPRLFRDARGGFAELHHAARYAAAGAAPAFVQDNVARSAPGVLRGLHLQHPHAQGKLVTALSGVIFDVAVDVRVGSPTFGHSAGALLDGGRFEQLYVPPGFAHGYLVTAGEALVHYKCTDYYRPECEVTLRWDDPAFGIAWPAAPAVVSDKDARGLTLAEALGRGLLPRYVPGRAPGDTPGDTPDEARAGAAGA